MVRIRYQKGFQEGCFVSKDTFLINGDLWNIVYDSNGFSIVQHRAEKVLLKEPMNASPAAIKKRIKFVLKSLGVPFSDEVRNKLDK